MRTYPAARFRRDKDVPAWHGLDFQARENILKIHSRKMNLMRGINLRRVAEKMTSCSGAECKVCV